ncbi:putative transporter small subunit [Paracoccus cavernae]|uniref:Transporter small subunit n=1 Tax=Paracoccus cavernae TaxID=1571207 RepID=A0ABT8DDV1_9RHOB|nr:putative transporter small subunit [Paracoccus cavernae]
MSTTLLTIYVLIWPAIVAIVLWVLVSAFFKEWREARRDGRPLI